MNEGSDVVDTPKIENKVQDEEIPLAKPNTLRGAWGNGAPVIGKKVVEIEVEPKVEPKVEPEIKIEAVPKDSSSSTKMLLFVCDWC